MMARLKAYQVSDGNDGCCIYFAANSATARREGAGEIGCEWEDIDYCNRRPEFDQFAPGPVPAQVLIEHGWWFECGNCYAHVTEDTPDPQIDGYYVYCCQSCKDSRTTDTGGPQP
jgi:hypothetical protein